MIFGSPSHRLEGQLKATAIVLDIEAEFVHMPNILVASFGDIDTKTSQTHFLKVNSVLQLGRLHNVHNIYRSVVHDEIGVEEATSQLNKLIRSKPMYGALGKTVLTSLCTALICPLAFGGSFLDMLIAGGEGALLSWLQFGVASKNALYSNVFEYVISGVSGRCKTLTTASEYLSRSSCRSSLVPWRASGPACFATRLSLQLGSSWCYPDT